MGWHRPLSLEQALAIRAARPVTVIAGGTDVFPALAAGRGWGDPARPELLDLGAVPGLDAIEETPAGWRIGCRVTWARLAATPLPPLFDGLKAAALEVGGAQVQNRGTLAGNLVTASPAADGIPNLLALEAAVELVSLRGRRVLPLAAFLAGYRATALAADEILAAILVPALPGARSAFRKLGARRHLVISIVMAAAVLACEGGRIAAARLAVGACSAVAQRLPEAEAALIGAAPAEAAARLAPGHLDRLSPIDDIRGSAAYRRAAALTLLRDLLEALA